jgi:hypothetical protein
MPVNDQSKIIILKTAGLLTADGLHHYLNVEAK